MDITHASQPKRTAEQKAASVEFTRQWRLKNPEWTRRLRREWAARHRDDVRRRSIEWNKAHPVERKEAKHRRRASELGAGGTFTVREFQDLVDAAHGLCTYCGERKPLEPDHATPLSRGGSNDISNIVPACHHCNQSKGTKTVEEFLAFLMS